MRSAALLFLFAQVAHSFVLPLKLAAVVNQTEQAEVLTYQSELWTTTVVIGTPGKTFTVVVDTTTSFLYVNGAGSLQANHTYNPFQSTTYQATDLSFFDPSMFGNVNGPIAMDTVVLGETPMGTPGRTSVTVPNAYFGTSSDCVAYQPLGIDGILGLAFPSLAPAGSTPVFQTAINQGDVKKGTFVIWLEDQWATSDNGTHGVIYYGDDDYLHCKINETQFYPISKAARFQITMTSFNSTVQNTYTYKAKTQTIIDSTSPYIGVPRMAMNTILSQLGMAPTGNLPVTVPCNTKIDLAFNFVTRVEHVNELNLILQQPNGSCKLGLIHGYDTSSGGTTEIFSLGIPFLRGRCTYFDVAHQQVGFSDPITHGPHFPPTTTPSK